MNQLTPQVFQRLDHLGAMLREKLQSVFDELEVAAQVTGVASLFGVHFTTEEITDYRSVVHSDRDMQKAMFIGMLNEGFLLQETCGGALNILSTEADVDALVDATRRVALRVG